MTCRERITPLLLRRAYRIRELAAITGCPYTTVKHAARVLVELGLARCEAIEHPGVQGRRHYRYWMEAR